ncbi:DUF4255 domain-containing protein [Danxiaibacter flavus]|uniref:DUF4255 domain-containing protein n=1 Tax=Danxiaibacter flavus TaxID=3049108 RepID=A0ABV3ZCM9_9BACT|nr:DUF4255 domain-containing protein [Chitinophagaceae bacterium DXS]
MIAETLICLTDEINEFFRTKLRVTEDKVVISPIVNLEGKPAIVGENKIFVTLLNIEKETVIRPGLAANSINNRTSNNAALNINLYVMAGAYFSSANYAEGLKLLSLVISFLQQKGTFTKDNTTRLPNEIDKLIFEMESPGLDKLNNIWAMLGARYVPSVIYKVRMLTFDSSVTTEYRPQIGSLSNDTNA